jgi:hypothetical protein
MQKDFYSEFVIKNKDHLKDLSSVSWWKFEQDSNPWLVRGFVHVEGTPRYSLLMTNFSRVFFSTAGPSQIQREVQEFNPIVLGGVSGVLPLLQAAISSFDVNSKYLVNEQLKSFEIQAVIKGLFQFKWVFSLEKLEKSISRKVMQRLIFLPLVNTIAAQEAALKLLEDQNKRKPDVDLRLLQNNDFSIFLGPSQNLVNSSTLASIQAEENKVKKIIKLDEPVAVKRKPASPSEKLKEKPLENLRKPDDYIESQQELKRKQAIQAKLMKKKEKSKLDFL